MTFSLHSLRRPLIAVLLVIGTALGWAGYLRLSGNFHTVEDGVLYRSAQLDSTELAEHLQASHIRTVLNLRGRNLGKPWYDDEIRVSGMAGVQHIDMALSAVHEVTDAQVRQLGEIISHAPRPILVHCEGGADRTGLVVALYKLLARGDAAHLAKGALSFRYGHFPWLGSRSAAMDRTLDRVIAQTRLCDRAPDAAAPSDRQTLSCPVRESWHSHAP